MKNTRTELVATMVAAMIFSYFLGFYDGAYVKHHTNMQAAEVR